jgi:ribosomal protein L40E
MRCVKCGAENPDRAKFCVECAAPFARRCPSCSTENPPTAKFCLECAKPLDSPVGQSQRVNEASTPIKLNAETGDHSIEGERKTVTALFADIKGSMELIENLDPEEARAIVDPALKLMMEAVHHYGGYVRNRPATASSRSSARPSPTKTIRSAHYLRDYGCRWRSSATPRSCEQKKE